MLRIADLVHTGPVKKILYQETTLKKLLTNPLLHFLLIGMGLFLLYEWVKPANAGEEVILIDDEVAGRAVLLFQKEWGRMPTKEEFDGLIERQVKQEVMYRQALKMNLDHNDELIRRRMEQKLSFITNDLATMEEPTDAALKDYYAKNQRKYQTPPRYSFVHIYFSPDKRPAARKDAEQMLAGKLPDPDNLAAVERAGDAFPFLSNINRAGIKEIGSQLGDTFAESLQNLPLGKWTGPVLSGYGTHLIYLKEKLPAEIPPLAAVRDDVLRDYQYAAYQTYNDKIYEDFKKQYKIKMQLTDSLYAGQLLADTPKSQ